MALYALVHGGSQAKQRAEPGLLSSRLVTHMSEAAPVGTLSGRPPGGSPRVSNAALVSAGLHVLDDISVRGLVGPL